VRCRQHRIPEIIEWRSHVSAQLSRSTGLWCLHTFDVRYYGTVLTLKITNLAMSKITVKIIKIIAFVVYLLNILTLSSRKYKDYAITYTYCLILRAGLESM